MDEKIERPQCKVSTINMLRKRKLEYIIQTKEDITLVEFMDKCLIIGANKLLEREV